jgi:hypothetical protein
MVRRAAVVVPTTVVRVFLVKATTAATVTVVVPRLVVVAVVLVRLALIPLLAAQVVLAVQVQQTLTRGQALPIRLVVVAVATRQVVRLEMPLLVLVAEMRQVLTQQQIVVVVVVVVATEIAAATAALVASSCVGSPQKPQAQDLPSQRQARQRTELTVLTLGMRGIQQELWWFRNGTFRKSRKRYRSRSYRRRQR